jgi:hypothetical protein
MMTIQTLTNAKLPVVPVVPVEYRYWAEAAAVPRLRSLTALEQMYAYWGSDRA